MISLTKWISCRERLPVEDSLGERLPSIQRGRRPARARHPPARWLRSLRIPPKENLEIVTNCHNLDLESLEMEDGDYILSEDEEEPTTESRRRY